MAMKYTADNDEIRAWMEEHGALPAVLKETSDNGEESPDMLQISFNPNDPNMKEMDWEEFFERFENENLALVYDDATPKGEIPEFELTDRTRARDEYGDQSIELPDSGDEEVLRENITPDSDFLQ